MHFDYRRMALYNALQHIGEQKQMAENERTSQSSPLSVLCDSVRASTTRYALLRRILVGLAAHIKPVRQRSEMQSVIDAIDVEVIGGIEGALSNYCEERSIHDRQ
jgi:hypothetical protein